LASFVRAGHRVALHSYDAVANVPAGVECLDANAIVSRDRLFVHADTGSYSLFSNYFRYQLLRRSLGVYIDCDLICLRSIDTDRAYVLGFEDAQNMNGAVLKLPSNSPVLSDLEALFDRRVFTPPWYSLREQLKQHARAWLKRPADLAHAPWGSAGPKALTYYAERHGLARYAEPPEVFYPVHWRDIRRLLDPQQSWPNLITERTQCVHLWNENLRHHTKGDPPPGSPLREFLDGRFP
jgi:hypothetical protein